MSVRRPGNRMNIEPTISPREIRKIIIEESRRANVGHIGSALSIADIIAVLFGYELRLPGIADPTRDRFVLGKGHAALALYAALHLKGFLKREELRTYCGVRTLLGVHPEHRLAGIEFSTGSLGQGLAYGAGVALAARLAREGHLVFVLVSDAECNEGSLWETIMFCGHHKLSNLVAIVDDNGQQALGMTRNIIDLQPLGEKWRAFGWDVYNVDGHNVSEMRDLFCKIRDLDAGPKVVIAKTVAGKGVSFMEGRVDWHYLPLSEEQFVQAMKEVEEGQEP
jgi:transketolase